MNKIKTHVIINDFQTFIKENQEQMKNFAKDWEGVKKVD